MITPEQRKELLTCLQNFKAWFRQQESPELKKLKLEHVDALIDLSIPNKFVIAEKGFGRFIPQEPDFAPTDVLATENWVQQWLSLDEATFSTHPSSDLNTHLAKQTLNNSLIELLGHIAQIYPAWLECVFDQPLCLRERNKTIELLILKLFLTDTQMAGLNWLFNEKISVLLNHLDKLNLRYGEVIIRQRSYSSTSLSSSAMGTMPAQFSRQPVTLNARTMFNHTFNNLAKAMGIETFKRLKNQTILIEHFFQIDSGNSLGERYETVALELIRSPNLTLNGRRLDSLPAFTDIQASCEQQNYKAVIYSFKKILIERGISNLALCQFLCEQFQQGGITNFSRPLTNYILEQQYKVSDWRARCSFFTAHRDEFFTPTHAGNAVHIKMVAYLAKIKGFAPPPEITEDRRVELCTQFIVEYDLIIHDRTIKCINFCYSFSGTEQQTLQTSMAGFLTSYSRQLVRSHSFAGSPNQSPIPSRKAISCPPTPTGKR